jgi:hypothetical protein
VVELVRRFGSATPPDTLLGMPRAPSAAAGEPFGQYGRGVTQALVAALPRRLAGSLTRQLEAAAGVTRLPEGLVVAVGPVGVLLTVPGPAGENWLVAGTITREGLARAATELAGTRGTAR